MTVRSLAAGALAATVLVASSPASAAAPVSVNGPLTIGEVRGIDSQVLSERRSWRISRTGAKNPAVIIYVIDAERLFAPVSAYCGYLSGMRGASGSGCRVVGVDTGAPPLRTRDLTPTASAARRDGTVDESAAPQGGGSERFERFILKELVPAAEADLPPAASPRRVLLGHSFGGLLVLDMLRRHPLAFDDFVAIDPSLWWDRGSFTETLSAALAALPERSLTGRSLFIGIGAAPRRENRLHMEKARGVDENWRPALERIGLGFETRFYPEDNHGTVALPGFLDAMKRILVKRSGDRLERKAP